MTSLNTPSRWALGVVGGFLLLWAAQCRGEHIGRADATIDFNDSLAKVAAKQTAEFQKVRAADIAQFADSLTKLAALKASADSQVAKANRSTGRITIIGSAKAPETSIDGGAQPEPDTTAYVAIQRQGDARTYTVPKFVFDAQADVRNALAAKTREAEAAAGALTLAQLTIVADSNTIRSQGDELTHRKAAEDAAKEKAGGGCSVLFIPCPPRWVTFTLGTIGGGIIGYEVAKR